MADRRLTPEEIARRIDSLALGLLMQGHEASAGAAVDLAAEIRAESPTLPIAWPQAQLRAV